MQAVKQVFSFITFRKLVNAFRLVSSYQLSRWMKKNMHGGMPMSIAIEPTTACNLGCPECPSGLKKFTRPTGNLQKQLFQKVLDEIGQYLINVTFYFQGEPYIHPQFLDLVQMASNKKIFTSTSTNAHFITKEVAEKTVQSGLSQMIISIDGTTQEIYEQYRKKGDLNKVLAGAKEMIAAKDRLKSASPKIIFQFLVVKPNEHQIEDAKRLSEELGFDEIRFKSAQLYEYENGNELMPSNEEYRRYRQLKSGKWIIKNKMENHCWKMWHSTVVTWDGKLVPCCFDKDATHQLGNVNGATTVFKDIWNGQKYQLFRTAVLKGRKNIDICRNCTEGSKVWLEEAL
ncbi:MAG: radical SAM/SPASM domain-containing protein [Flavobacteriales bacterium]